MWFKTVINHPIVDGLYIPFMGYIWEWFIIVLTTLCKLQLQSLKKNTHQHIMKNGEQWI